MTATVVHKHTFLSLYNTYEDVYESRSTVTSNGFSTMSLDSGLSLTWIHIVLFQDHKKVREQMITEKETLFGSRPSPAKGTLSAKKGERGPRISNIGGANGHTPAASRRLSLGSNAIMQQKQPEATPELSRNGSLNSRANGKHRPAAVSVTAAAPAAVTASIEKENACTDNGRSAPTSPVAQL